MPIIDAQVHCYERNHPGRPWHAVLAGPPEVTGPDMVKAMDAVGVDAAHVAAEHPARDRSDRFVACEIFLVTRHLLVSADICAVIPATSGSSYVAPNPIV